MPNVPAGAKKPEDHKPKAADKFEFDFEDEHYVVEKDALEDLNFIELMQDDKSVPAWRLALGEKNWQRFKDSVQDKKTGRVPKAKYDEFFENLQEAAEDANLS